MVAPAMDKSRHGKCAVTKEKSGMAGALGRGGGNDGSFGCKGSSVGGARACRRS